MRTPLINRIMSALASPAPLGCQTPTYRRSLEDFFQKLTKGGHLKYYLRFRNLAQYESLPRSHWPAAVEKFFGSLTKADAAAAYERFRSWLQIHRPIYVKPVGPMGIGLEKVSHHLRAQGLISWAFDHRYKLKIERSWTRCDPSFREKVEEYVRHVLAQDYSTETVRNLKTCLRAFGKYLNEHKLAYFAMTYERAVAFNNWVLAQSGWSRWHQRSVIEKARNFYKWLLQRKDVSENHFDTLRPIGVIQSLPTFLTEDEMNLVLDQPLDVQARALIEFFYATGCRIKEAIGLNVADLSLKTRSIKCLGKGRKERVLLFNKATEQALKEYLKFRAALLKSVVRPNEPALFVGRWGRKICNIAINDAIRSACYKAGITKRVTPHVIRHSFATHMLNHGADLYSLMTLLGHAYIESTIRYLHVATERLSTVYRKCHPRK